MSAPRILVVAPGSPAARAGLAPGDEILAMNGQVPRDVIAYQLLADDADLVLEVERGGLGLQIEVTKAAGESLGIEVHSALFDQVRTCDNHCEFCFIYQLPPGMRSSLYLKDDDFRLSFLYGNFTTLTRFTEADLERVVTERLSPLNVSIHATDPDVRTEMLRNRRGATSLRWLRALLDHGIEVHGQVVVCPGINDGAVLDDTLVGVLDQYPELASLCVVPLGVSRYNHEPRMRPHTAAEAGAVLDTVHDWQDIYLRVLGHRLVFAGDEYYLLAGRSFPEPEAYEGFRMHEDGVGMARTFELEFQGELAEPTGPMAGFFASVDGAPAEGYRAPRLDASGCATPNQPDGAVVLRPRRDAPIAVLTSEYGAAVVGPLVAGLDRSDVRVIPVRNDFFGGTTAVTGLLVGEDLSRVLADEPAGHRYLLPDVCLSQGRFLDGTTPEQLPRPVEIVSTDGIALRRALDGDRGSRPPPPDLETAEMTPTDPLDSSNDDDLDFEDELVDDFDEDLDDERDDDAAGDLVLTAPPPRRRGGGEEVVEPLGVVAIVGRPNVGKSTLLNRIVGRREAIVEEKPGVTRDRKEVAAEWQGTFFTLVDTGGWMPGGTVLDEKVSRQSEKAMTDADAILFVVDTTVGVTEEDGRVAALLRRAERPVFLAVNKVDDTNREASTWEFVKLGLGDPYPVSALHGRGTGDLLDALVAALPGYEADRARVRGRALSDDDDGMDPAGGASDGPKEFAVALVGRPNVGKSTLFNRLIGEERAVVHDMPGTTRDTVDTVVDTPTGPVRFIDTAGMRRKAKIDEGTEYYSLVRALKAIDDADVALLIIDATVGITHQDQRLAERVDAAGCPIVVLLNKWETLDAEQRLDVTYQLGERLHFLGDSPVLKISALTGKGVNRLLPVLSGAIDEYHKRVPTRKVNEVIRQAQNAQPAPHGARVRYALQGAVDPPTFTLFANKKLPQTYLRYLERRLRESFDFGSTPIKVRVRIKD